MSELSRKAGEALSFPGKIVGWLVLPLIVSVCLGVLAAKVGTNRLADWGVRVPLFDTGVTVNTLLDLQWHIFALLVLFGGVYAYRDRSHVSVDFLASGFSARTRAVVDLVCDLIFLLPFCLIIVWFGTRFAHRAYVTGEGSTYGGMIDRWMIKACIPLAFSLLGLAAVNRIIGTAIALARGDFSAKDKKGS
ncbi:MULTISPECIES: TRAP transporter small permease subunit [unclassified Stappia]|uniref:TRAP transporter small permease subunit n=1 Tax=unclassified Stappia TaxID=2629676 RepID=UPI001643AF72|nr:MULTISPECIES: TRAP transporter small permease subunit [unclassified Stappia]